MAVEFRGFCLVCLFVFNPSFMSTSTPGMSLGFFFISSSSSLTLTLRCMLRKVEVRSQSSANTGLSSVLRDLGCHENGVTERLICPIFHGNFGIGRAEISNSGLLSPV